MSAVPVLLELAVGEAPSQVSLAEADAIAATAQDLGVTAVRLVDRVGEQPAIDPSMVAAHLAGRYPDLGWLIDAPTTHNAPYNLARRILSVDRATGGRAGLVLIPGGGDEVSDAAVPDCAATDPAERWAEYADIVTRLWESFPAAALLGDQQRAVVVDDVLIRPVDFRGRFYRVGGPLDGPSSLQGRPMLVAAAPTEVGWARIAAIADAAIVELNEINYATAQLRAALHATGRRREDVALLVRTTDPEIINHATADLNADGIVIAANGGAPEMLAALRRAGRQDTPQRRATLRATLTIPSPEGVST
ncbi:LLM class flavin-dependent oxidoreductase [Mycolicibacterium smegmatis]|uniref:Monooxygenase n=2 Tax=Mycolicibacterium smegmatis (strain ATCC 700084 / mc(2)155) TaxID=246196 RepID=I7GCV0_MYCS2|nr:LLM class flavin-dependent oxidoreductase [Mycolicibacterium smegmatis]ABK76152.1 putative monooxygenase [Mycolicibacterium smegmatis MC2 155]AFP40454.1 Putative monooxygenase [Mycolicibacterium smegmatis MC2 155]AIU09196.1 monooxygenase [Mycolicibacterium smegmatis MC2 155]AIU15821.1 monooxygenase [Mycolicibacterium smegmatis]AIU22444.1 monooxygenase [Mycolicibacterium smegmatis]